MEKKTKICVLCHVNEVEVLSVSEHTFICTDCDMALLDCIKSRSKSRKCEICETTKGCDPLLALERLYYCTDCENKKIICDSCNTNKAYACFTFPNNFYYCEDCEKNGKCDEQLMYIKED